MLSRFQHLRPVFAVIAVIATVALTGSAAAATSTATATATAAASASPAAAGGWHVVSPGSLPCREWHGSEYNAEIQDVTAVSARDAWASGQCVAGGAVAGIVGHWNGQRWTSVKLPAQADLDLFPGGDNLIAAESASDAWVAAAADDVTGRDANVAVHWNGHRWSVQTQGLPAGNGFVAIAASVAAGTWAIVRLEDQGPTGNPRAVALVHWTGRTWQQIAFPSAFDALFPPDELTVGPRGTVWVGGDAGTGGSGVPLIAEYSGGKWRALIRLAQRTQLGGRVDGFAVAGSSVWAIVDYLAVPSSDVLVRIAGGSRTYLTAPGASNGTITAAAGDSHGGLYLVRPLVSGLRYWNGRTWTTDSPPVPRDAYPYKGTTCYPVGPMPTPPTPGVNVLALAPVPGTADVWASGFVAGGSLPLYPACAEPTAQPLTEIHS